MTTHKRYLRGVVVLGLLALTTLASPASAGQGASTFCSNEHTTGGTEVPIEETVVTVAVEAGLDYLQICYSTTPVGSGNTGATGGWVEVDLTPGRVTCTPDTSPIVVGLGCEVDANTARVTVLVQSVPITVGVEYAFLDSVVCLRQVVVTTPTGSTPPLDIGACV
jgi:hypothetical protein